MNLPTTKAEAKFFGHRHYHTGKKCPQGHIADRFVSTGTCVVCNREKTLKYAKRHPEKTKIRNRNAARRFYEIPEPTRSPPADNCCELCGKEETRRHVSLDHCHTTGEFRGWLCGDCNLGLGKLGDSVEGIKKALAYLEKASKPMDCVTEV